MADLLAPVPLSLSAMPWLIAAASAQIALGLYLTVIDHVDLFPWNDLAGITLRERLLRLGLNSMPHFLFAWAFLRGLRPVLLAAMLFYIIALAMHIDFWWRPYLVGATERQRSRYERRYLRTRKILPPIKDHPVPDAQHVVAGALATMALALTIAGALSAL